MPSFRSKFCRFLTKCIVSVKFNPSRAVDEMRRSVESLSKLTRLPSGTHIEEIRINGIAAEWIHTAQAHEGRVVLYLHGGGYNICSPNTHRELAARISMASGAKVLLPKYRLSPEHPFPCALEDAISAHRWLLDNGIPGGNIAIAGDSAGGGLSIATTLSLRDTGEPLPASIACISPWTDLEMTGQSIQTRAKIDPMLNLQLLKMMASNYIGASDSRAPLISTINADLDAFPPLLIHVGSDEMLLTDSTRMADKAKRSGVDVTLKIYDQMWHVFHLYAGYLPEAEDAIKSLGLFLKKHFMA